MDRVLDLEAATSRTVNGYVTRSMNAKLYYFHDDAQKSDAVIVVPHDRTVGPHVMLMTRIDGDKVIIEADTTDRPLDEALIAAGIPRDRIVFAVELQNASS